jgi:hypothetical protein
MTPVMQTEKQHNRRAGNRRTAARQPVKAQAKAELPNLRNPDLGSSCSSAARGRSGPAATDP